MRFDLSMPILPHNMRLELRQLVEESLPQIYPVASRLQHTLRLSGLDDTLASDPALGVLLYRFARGALANVYEHAEASHVCVEAERRGDDLLLRVTDDGEGLDVAHIDRFVREGHYFFHDVRIRAAQLGGTFDVESRPGRGTTLKLRVPLGQRRAASS
jgi:signal transduction histidine kinase